MTSPTSPKRKTRQQDLTSPEARELARQFVQEGLQIRYANLLRRFAVGKNAIKVSELASSPLVRKVADGWRVTKEGFVRSFSHVEGPNICKLVNADKDDLGVYSCVKDEKGYRVVFEF